MASLILWWYTSICEYSVPKRVPITPKPTEFTSLVSAPKICLDRLWSLSRMNQRQSRKRQRWHISLFLKGCNRASLWWRSPCLSGFSDQQSAIHGITRVPKAQFLNMLKPAHCTMLLHMSKDNLEILKSKNSFLAYFWSNTIIFPLDDAKVSKF